MTWRDETEREPAGGCAAFEAALPDYLDHSLAADAADAAAAHVAGCDVCRQLVNDLLAIRTQAAALPSLHPSRDLWAGIDARIGGQRSGLGRQPSEWGTARPTALRRWFGPHYATRVAALAAGLVVATAGLTYLTTRSLIGDRRDTVHQAETASAPAGDGPSLSGRSGQQLVSREAQTSEYLYDAQIASLHEILEQRRGQLNPKTVAVIERSLGVIDTAIAQSKAALAKDPANGFLVDQLDRDLDSKLELLRTVALLPSRT
jgi:hypothetical protein